MTEQPQDVLWKNFPRTAIEFERRFATEADCRAYWIEARWGVDRRRRVPRQRAPSARPLPIRLR